MPGDYIALSHCWGITSPLKTLRSNLDAHKSRINWASLPVLFRDVIAVARDLGLQFLWIDSLCIIQDDDADWQRESALMAPYYGNAWLTIAASSSSNGSHGCFPAPRQDAIPLAGPKGCEDILVHKMPKHFIMKRIRFDNRNPVAMPLFDRAWAYQESLLSRRVLHFGPEEMVWECSSNLSCECGEPPDIYSGLPEPRIESFRESYELAITGHYNRGLYWQTLLEMYLVRTLSFDDDRLKAIEGLSKHIRRLENEALDDRLGTCMLGVWSTNLPSALLWTKLSSEGSRNLKFPTWSWASINGPWIYQSPSEHSSFTSSVTFVDPIEETWDVERPYSGKTYLLIFSARALSGILSGVPRWTLLDVAKTRTWFSISISKYKISNVLIESLPYA